MIRFQKKVLPLVVLMLTACGSTQTYYTYLKADGINAEPSTLHCESNVSIVSVDGLSINHASRGGGFLGFIDYSDCDIRVLPGKHVIVLYYYKIIHGTTVAGSQYTSDMIVRFVAGANRKYRVGFNRKRENNQTYLHPYIVDETDEHKKFAVYGEYHGE